MINNTLTKVIERKINSNKNDKFRLKKLYFLYNFLNFFDKKCEKNEYFTTFFDKK